VLEEYYQEKTTWPLPERVPPENEGEVRLPAQDDPPPPPLSLFEAHHDIYRRISALAKGLFDLFRVLEFPRYSL